MQFTPLILAALGTQALAAPYAAAHAPALAARTADSCTLTAQHPGDGAVAGYEVAVNITGQPCPQGSASIGGGLLEALNGTVDVAVEDFTATCAKDGTLTVGFLAATGTSPAGSSVSIPR